MLYSNWCMHAAHGNLPRVGTFHSTLLRRGARPRHIKPERARLAAKLLFHRLTARPRYALFNPLSRALRLALPGAVILLPEKYNIFIILIYYSFQAIESHGAKFTECLKRFFFNIPRDVR